MDTKNQKGFSAVMLVLVLVIIGLIGAVGYLVYDRQNESNKENTVASVETTADKKEDEQITKKQTTEPTTKTYSNTELGYSFEYPKAWAVSDVPKPEDYNGVYVTQRINTSDFQESNDVYGGTLKGADIYVNAYTKQAGEPSIQSYIDGSDRFTSEQKAVTVAGQQGVEYLWKYEGPYRLITMFHKGNLIYTIYYKDTASTDYAQYVDEYREIVKSFKFN